MNYRQHLKKIKVIDMKNAKYVIQNVHQTDLHDKEVRVVDIETNRAE